jgi:carboxyl-terminal processing protease
MLVRRVALVLMVLVLVLAAYLYGRSQSLAGIPPEDKKSVDLYAQALKTVREDYVDQESIDSNKQTYAAIGGMLDSLGDKGHTRFLTPDEVEKNREGLSEKYVGVGIRLKEKDSEAVVSSPIDGSPAKAAGIKSGDVLVAVDGESVEGEKVEDISKKVRGPEGSEVELTVRRDGEEKKFSIERAELKVPAASYQIVPGTDVAQVRLTAFSENSAETLKNTIAEAQAAGAKRFVLDLRDNAGGLVEQAEKVAAQLLPEGSGIYIRKDANGQEEQKVPKGDEPLDAPMVVLVNKGTASAAEILAGALEDDNRAKLVGETTFGTGTVLDQYPLSDGSAVLLAVAEWLTPRGNFIRGAGITPDVEVKLDKDQQPITPDEAKDLSKKEIFDQDVQLERAYEALEGQT